MKDWEIKSICSCEGCKKLIIQFSIGFCQRHLDDFTSAENWLDYYKKNDNPSMKVNSILKTYIDTKNLKAEFSKLCFQEIKEEVDAKNTVHTNSYYEGDCSIYYAKRVINIDNAYLYNYENIKDPDEKYRHYFTLKKSQQICLYIRQNTFTNKYEIYHFEQSDSIFDVGRTKYTE